MEVDTGWRNDPDLSQHRDAASVDRDIAAAEAEVFQLQRAVSGARRRLVVVSMAVVVGPAAALMLSGFFQWNSLSSPVQQTVWAAGVLAAFLEWQALRWWIVTAQQFWRLSSLRGRLGEALAETRTLAAEAVAVP